MNIGCANSLFTKYQDNQCVENCDDPNPARRVLFEQPVWQTLQMFIGEVRFCLYLYSVTSVRWLRYLSVASWLGLNDRCCVS